MSTVEKSSEHEATSAPLLPPTGFLRLSRILGDKSEKPEIPALIPLSKSAWWVGVKSGKFPKPIKLAPRVTVWRVEDILDLIAKAGEGSK